MVNDATTSPNRWISSAAKVLRGLFALHSIRKRELPEVLLVCGMFVYSLFFSIYLTQKYQDFRTGYFDFGQAVQTAWLVSQGHLNALALGRPITIIAGLVYAIYPHPETLLALQSSALSTGALAIYVLAKRELGNKWFSLTFSLLYLINPLLWGVSQYEYHDLAFSVPFLLFAVYFYATRRFRPYLVSLTLALMCNPFVIIIATVMAIWFLMDSRSELFAKRSLVFPLATAITCVAFIVYLQIIPLLPFYHLYTLGIQSYTFLG